MSIPPNHYGGVKSATDALLFDDGSGVSTSDYAALVQRVSELEDRLRNSVQTPVTAIANLLRVSDFDHSINSYTGAGAVDELFGWFRGVSTANPIKDAGTDPLWDKANGWIEWSSDDPAHDLSYHFPQRIIRPGRTMHLMLSARLKDAASARNISLIAGLWDESGGVQNWISDSIVGSASSLAPIVTKVGGAAAATTWKYKVVAYTEEPSLIVSTEGSVLGAAALTSTNYNAISWGDVPGATRYRVYRTSPGGNAGLIADITSGATSFNDQGVTLQAGAVPPAAAPAQAVTQQSAFGGALTTDWKVFRYVIRVPRAYNFAATGSDKQWLRLGLRGGTPPAILIDRVGLSLSPGVWAAAPEDRLAAADTVITPIGDGGQYLGDINPFDPYLPQY